MIYAESLLAQSFDLVKDLPSDALAAARGCGVVAWDIETSGLNWKTDRIGTCQVYLPNHNAYVIQINNGAPRQLKSLLADARIVKIFHHAMFDLRFMAYQWSVVPTNIVCTKIASKILAPDEGDHSLKALLERNLGITLNKELRRSDWLSTKLTDEQVMYAVSDVVHLPKLYRFLRQDLLTCQKWPLAKATFDYIPARVQLDIQAYGDLFQY